MINQHSSPITRNILAKDDCLRKAHTLYRGVNLSSLDYLFSLSHRVYVAKNLARYLATSHIIFAFNLREYDTIESGPYWGHFVAMVQNIWPHLMILGHFLESFRADLIQIVQRQDIKSSHPVPRRILPPLDQEITEQIIRIQPAFLELLDLPLIALSTGLRIGSNEFIPMLTRFDVFSFGTYLTSNEVESNFDLVEADH
ncbi:MAG: hypothetical protein LQ342_001279 [Letrouitia transgressa]|nr:MAG: hypothetical protein LQ342_001279 [Letrouitia transgressa]